MQVKDEDVSTLIELQHNDMELLRVQKEIADLPEVVCVKIRARCGQNIKVADFLCGKQEALYVTCKDLILHFFDLLTQVLDLADKALGLCQKLARLFLETLGCTGDGHI